MASPQAEDGVPTGKQWESIDPGTPKVAVCSNFSQHERIYLLRHSTSQGHVTGGYPPTRRPTLGLNPSVKNDVRPPRRPIRGCASGRERAASHRPHVRIEECGAAEGSARAPPFVRHLPDETVRSQKVNRLEHHPGRWGTVSTPRPTEKSAGVRELQEVGLCDPTRRTPRRSPCLFRRAPAGAVEENGGLGSALHPRFFDRGRARKGVKKRSSFVHLQRGDKNGMRTVEGGLAAVSAEEGLPQRPR